MTVLTISHPMVAIYAIGTRVYHGVQYGRMASTIVRRSTKIDAAPKKSNTMSTKMTNVVSWSKVPVSVSAHAQMASSTMLRTGVRVRGLTTASCGGNWASLAIANGMRE